MSVFRISITATAVFFSWAILCSLSWAAPDNALQQLRARVYSTTAAELFWNRPQGERVEVEYNGSLLGVFDSNSLFVADLDATLVHRFTLRSIDDNAVRSEARLLEFSSATFQQPFDVTESVAASVTGSLSGSDFQSVTQPGSTTDTADALVNVRASIYSSNTLELLWDRQRPVRVRVLLNGNEIDRLDASSLYVTGVQAQSILDFEIQVIDGDLVTGERYTLSADLASFTGSVQEIAAVRSGAVSTVDNTTSSADSQPVSQNPPPAQDDALDDASAVAVAVAHGDCVVRNLGDLSACINAAAAYDRINIRNNLVCEGSSCCPAGGALMTLVGVSSLAIEGNGHRLLRKNGQRQCSLLDISNASDITLRNWSMDDDASVSGCQVEDRCPRMLHIRNSNDVALNNVTVRYGKGYAIYVQSVNGFEFVNSTLSHSGVLGLYVGHDNQSSTRIRIENSVFTDNQTNAVALLGVTGASPSTNRVQNNLFLRNHWRGQWQVAPRFGTGFTGGGQLYLAQAEGVTVSGNTIADGYCENCYVQQDGGTGISGIELSKPNASVIRRVVISDNEVRNHDAWGIFLNQGASVDSTVQVRNNRLINNRRGLKMPGAQVSGNTVVDR